MNPHLPAGRPGQGGGPPPGVDMGSMSGPGMGRRGGNRPSYPPQYHQQQQPPPPPQIHQQHPHVSQMYHNPFLNNYTPYGYAMGPPPFATSAPIPNGYMPYQQHYQRSPPTMPNYSPIPGPGMPQHYNRGPQHSPVIVSSPLPPPNQHHAHIQIPAPYQVPPPPPPPPAAALVEQPTASTAMPPPTPSSTHSSQALHTPSSPASTQANESTQQLPEKVEEVFTVTPLEPFRAPLPWLSRPELPFPKKPSRSRRRRRLITEDDASVELPPNPQEATETQRYLEDASNAGNPTVKTPRTNAAVPPSRSPIALAEELAREPLPEQTTPASAMSPNSIRESQATTITSASPQKHVKAPSRAAIPAIPIVPVVPRSTSKDMKQATTAEQASPDPALSTEHDRPAADDQASTAALAVDATNASAGEAPSETKGGPQVSTAPKLWTGLFSKPATGKAAPSSIPLQAPNGTGTAEASAAASGNSIGPFSKSNSSFMAEALYGYRVGGAEKVAFLEPRGLINTGNMCYMNSVLQVLVFCIPFYDFLDQAGKKAVHSFKSDTPLIDAMIMFMREYKIIDSATSVDQLRRRLRGEELDQFGEPFIPEFVYEAIKQLPRFASMKRGHQQDAEEFLGFLLLSLREECENIMKAAPPSSASTGDNSSLPTPTPSIVSDSAEGNNDWLEVGRRQRAAITRSSGQSSASSPISKIFGGQLRSELRIPGRKDSVTLEPYQSIQLDIGSAQVRNIMDALRGLTKPETLQGDFNSPRGRDVSASKQVFIESLPPVLILHLKRFQFDAEGFGTVKIWKKVGYPLELEIPREVFSRQKRNSILAEGAGLPKYRLNAVVYHHGKHASGGHYTVDILRQDGREWVRLDDTVIRRVRKEEVAEGGAEEEPSKVSDNPRKDAGPVGSTNRFAAMDDEDAGEPEDGWKQVSAPASGGKKWTSVVNGASTSTPKAKQGKESVKDNKVAYLLFYSRI